MSNLPKLVQLNQTATELQDADQILEQIRHQKQTQTGLTAGDLDTIAAVIKEHPAINDATVASREDAAGVEQLVAYIVADPQRSPVLAGLPRYVLPNSMAIVCYRDRHDIERISREIFEDHIYFKHGIVIGDGDCIFDVGAGIGFFTLFVQQLCPHAQVYAFEPAPERFEMLQINTDLYASKNVKLFNFGLADIHRATNFTVSDLLLGNNLERVHLLRLNTEGDELGILKGIRADDYARIEQIVMEVRSESLLEQVATLLKGRGYDITVEEQNDPKEIDSAGPTRYIVYCVQNTNGTRLLREQRAARLDRPLPIILSEPLLSKDEVYGFLQERLSYDMTPSAFVFVSTLPLNHQDGEIDLQALPVPGEADLISSDYSDHGFVAPRTAMEKELADIWAELLGFERVGIYDDFFRLGGDSILAANILSRVQERFQIQVPVDLLFEDTFTIARLARAFEQYQIEQADPDDIAAMLAELNELSDDEIRALLAEE